MDRGRVNLEKGEGHALFCSALDFFSLLVNPSFLFIRMFSIPYLLLLSIIGLKRNNFIQNIYPVNHPHR